MAYEEISVLGDNKDMVPSRHVRSLFCDQEQSCKQQQLQHF